MKAARCCDSSTPIRGVISPRDATLSVMQLGVVNNTEITTCFMSHGFHYIKMYEIKFWRKLWILLVTKHCEMQKFVHTEKIQVMFGYEFCLITNWRDFSPLRHVPFSIGKTFREFQCTFAFCKDSLCNSSLRFPVLNVCFLRSKVNIFNRSVNH